MGGWGLLTALAARHGTRLCALVVLLYVWALLGRRPVDPARPGCLPVSCWSSLLFGTTSVVYDVPRSPGRIGARESEWSSSSSSEHSGGPHRSIDIAGTFPGFPASQRSPAHGHRRAGARAEARWAQPFFALLRRRCPCTPVPVSSLSSSRRVPATARSSVALGDWIGRTTSPPGLRLPGRALRPRGVLRSVPPGFEGSAGLASPPVSPLPGGADLPRANRFWRSRWGTATLILGSAVVTVYPSAVAADPASRRPRSCSSSFARSSGHGCRSCRRPSRRSMAAAGLRRS